MDGAAHRRGHPLVLQRRGGHVGAASVCSACRCLGPRGTVLEGDDVLGGSSAGRHLVGGGGEDRERRHRYAGHRPVSVLRCMRRLGGRYSCRGERQLAGGVMYGKRYGVALQSCGPVNGDTHVTRWRCGRMLRTSGKFHPSACSIRNLCNLPEESGISRLHVARHRCCGQASCTQRSGR
eukprot:ctg_181.g77